MLYTGDLGEAIREEAYIRRPPVYPLFLGFALIAGSVLPVLLLQIMLSMFSIILVYRIFINDQKFVWLPVELLIIGAAAQGWILCVFKRRQPATTYPGS